MGRAPVRSPAVHECAAGARAGAAGAQVSTAAQAVASLRVSTPALISSELARCLEARGWGADAAAAAPLPGTPSCSGAAAALSPAPAELQGRVVLAVANMSALRCAPLQHRALQPARACMHAPRSEAVPGSRARLEEALGRLQRVTEAVEGEARRGPPCTVERAPRGSVLRPAAGAAGGQPSPKLGRAVESGRIATRRRAAKDVQPLPFVLG